MIISPQAIGSRGALTLELVLAYVDEPGRVHDRRSKVVYHLGHVLSSKHAIKRIETVGMKGYRAIDEFVAVLQK